MTTATNASPDDRPPPFRPKLEAVLRESVKGVLARYLGSHIGGELLDDLSFLVLAVLPRRTPRMAVYETLRVHVGERLTEETAHALAWRISGNIALIRTGRPALPLRSGEDPGWCLLQIMGSEPRVRGKAKKLGLAYVGKSLSGRMTPGLFRWFWSTGQAGFFSDLFGFNRKQRPYRDPIELVGLRAVMKLEYTDERLAPVSIKVPGYCKTYNRGILDRRNPGPVDCPRHYDIPCMRCSVGYRECPAAVHPETYERRECQNCGGVTFHNPDRTYGGTGGCLRCRKPAAM